MPILRFDQLPEGGGEVNELLALQQSLLDFLKFMGAVGIGGGLGVFIASIHFRRKPLTVPAEPSTRLEPRQWVKARAEMSWMYGPSVDVPAGAIIQLVDCHDTTAGPRWSGYWKRVFLSSIPEDMIEPYDWKQPQAFEVEGLPPSVSVYQPVPGSNWIWSVRDHVTGKLIESGSEETELRAVNMAWKAYDRTTEADTAIVESREV